MERVFWCITLVMACQVGKSLADDVNCDDLSKNITLKNQATFKVMCGVKLRTPHTVMNELCLEMFKVLPNFTDVSPPSDKSKPPVYQFTLQLPKYDYTANGSAAKKKVAKQIACEDMLENVTAIKRDSWKNIELFSSLVKKPTYYVYRV